MKLNIPCLQQRPTSSLPQIQSFDYNYTATTVTSCNKLPYQKVAGKLLEQPYVHGIQHEDMLDYYMAMAG
jgi:hypothetical protein